MRQRNPWNHGWRDALALLLFLLFVSVVLGSIGYYHWTKFKFYQRCGAEAGE